MNKCLSVVVLCATSAAWADTVFLKDGNLIQGQQTVTQPPTTSSASPEQNESLELIIKRAKLRNETIVFRQKKVEEVKGEKFQQQEYHRLELTDGTELIGFVRTMPNGDVYLSGNDFLPDDSLFKAHRVSRSRKLDYYTLNLKSGMKLAGYLLQGATNFIILDRIAPNSSRQKIPRNQISKIEKRNDIIFWHPEVQARARTSPPKKAAAHALKSPQATSWRFSLLGSYINTMGGLDDVIPSGFAVGASADYSWRKFRTEGNKFTGKNLLPASFLSIAFTRVEFSFSRMASDPHLLEQYKVAMGPLWLFQPFPTRYGTLATAFLLGTGIEHVANDTDSGYQPAFYFGALAGYEYWWGQFASFLHLRLNYSFDPSKPFIAWAVASGASHKI